MPWGAQIGVAGAFTISWILRTSSLNLRLFVFICIYVASNAMKPLRRSRRRGGYCSHTAGWSSTWESPESDSS